MSESQCVSEWLGARVCKCVYARLHQQHRLEGQRCIPEYLAKGVRECVRECVPIA